MKIHFSTALFLVISWSVYSQQVQDLGFTFTKPPSLTSIDVQSDGKIFIAGYHDYFQNSVSNSEFFRFNADGSVDSTFRYQNEEAISLVKVIENKVYVCESGIIRRLNPDGSVDSTFEMSSYLGNSVLDFRFSNDLIFAFAYSSANSKQAIFKLASDGSMDSTFMPVLLEWYVLNRNAISMVVQENGKLIFGSASPTYPEYILQRYNADGSIDTTFNVGDGFGNYIRDLHIEVDTSIPSQVNYLISGARLFNNTSVPRIIKIQESGSFDDEFVSNYESEYIYESEIRDIHLLKDGQILVLASNSNVFKNFSSDKTADAFYMVNGDGTLNMNFTPIEIVLNNDQGEIIASPDESTFYLIGGIESVNGEAVSGFVSISSSGELVDNLDITFLNNATISKISSLEEGKLIVAGDYSKINGVSAKAINVIDLTTKSLDESFHFPFELIREYSLDDLDLFPNNQILLTGQFSDYHGNKIQLMKLNTDGSVDSTFQSPELTQSNIYDPQATIDDDGIFVHGNFKLTTPTNTLYMAALNFDGSLNEGYSETIALREVLATKKISNSARIFSYGDLNEGGLIKVDNEGKLIDEIAESRNLRGFAPLIPVSEGSLLTQVLTDGRRNSLAFLDTETLEITETPIHFNLPSNYYVYSGTFSQIIEVSEDAFIISGFFDNLQDSIDASSLALVDLKREKIYDPLLFRVEEASTYFQRPLQDMIKLDDGSIIIAGNFVSIGGERATSLARIAGFDRPNGPANLEISKVSFDGISMSFDDNSLNELQFHIERSENDGAFEEIGVLNSNQVIFHDKDVTPGSKYTYKVIASNSFGISGFSNEATAELEALPLSSTEFDRLELYPNPSTGKIYYDLNVEFENIFVYDLSGKQYEIKPNESVIDLSEFKKGLYTIKFTGTKRKFQTRKILLK